MTSRECRWHWLGPGVLQRRGVSRPVSNQRRRLASGPELSGRCHCHAICLVLPPGACDDVLQPPYSQSVPFRPVVLLLAFVFCILLSSCFWFSNGDRVCCRQSRQDQGQPQVAEGSHESHQKVERTHRIRYFSLMS